MMCVVRSAALTKDADFREREIILNCLENAMGCVPDMQRCIIEARSRWVVEHFLSKCGDTATCTLWTRIRTLIDELRELLFNCNDVTGDPTLPDLHLSALALGNARVAVTASAHVRT